MKDNTEKCHLIMKTNESVDIQLGSLLAVRNDWEKVLGVTNWLQTKFWQG